MDAIERNIEITNEKLKDLSNRRLGSKPYIIRNESGFVFINKYIKDKSSTILDIGCRDGGLLKLFKNDGFENLYGIDIAEEALKTIKIDIHKKVCDAHHLTFPNGMFDIVTIVHTLEHCERPVDVINEIHRVLKPKGLLFIEVPLEGSARPAAGHFSFFKEKEELVSILSSFNVIEDFEDFRLIKGTDKKKRRWLRVVLERKDI
jgi:ubiquinone/menaquinone biosynthesis C-methylase UbiE